MPVRSLNGLDTSVRSLNGLSDRIDYTVSLPLTMNSDYNIKLSNLNSYGSANQILKMNGSGTALEYANETDTVHTAQTPIVIINGVIGLNGIAGYGNSIGQRQLIRTNSTNTALEYFPQPDFITGVQSPLAISSSGVISLSTLNSLGSANQILKMNSGGTALEYANETDTTYTVVSPLTISNNAISLSNLTSYGSANQILKVNSAGNALEYANETDTTYTGGTNITISSENVINLDSNLTNLSLINTFKVGGDATSEITLLRNNGNLFNGDYLKINSAGRVIGQNTKDTKNNILGTDNTSGVIAGTNLTKTVDTINGNITLSSTNTTYTVALPLTLSGQNKIGLAGLTSYGTDNQILRMNGTNSIEWSNEQDISNFITASSTDTLTNKSMSYGQITSRPFEVSYSAGLLFANYLGIFKTVDNRCMLFTNSSSNYRHGIKHNDTNLEFYLSTTNDGYTGLNKKLTIGLTSIQPTVDISLLAIGNSTGVSQLIKFNNDTNNTIGANFNTEVGNAGGLEIKGYAIIENIITRTDTTKNMRSILSYNGFHILKGTDLVNDKTLLLLRDGGTNYLGNVGNDLIIDGYNISIGSASGVMTLRSATLEYYYYNTTNMIFTAKIYDNKYEFQSKHIRCGGELNMRDNSTLGKINMADGPIFWRNRYKSGENNYITDFNHYTQYSSSPVDGIRHQGWNGVSLGYTNGGPGTALYTSGAGVYFGNGTPVSSDDRIKFNETKITYNALETINKLVVVEYDKKYNKDLPETQYGVEMENHLLNDTPQKEYGYIAQDTYNNIPELRFTIKNVDTTIPENFDENGLLIEDCKIRNTNSEGEEFIDRKYLSIDYANINVLNVKAVQELSEIVKQQQIIIDTLINSTTFANFKKNI